MFTARGERQVDNGASVTEKEGKTQNASVDVSHEARTWLSLLRVTQSLPGPAVFKAGPHSGWCHETLIRARAGTRGE